KLRNKIGRWPPSILFLKMLSSCNSIEITEEQREQIDQEINAINSPEEKEAYLEFLFEEDQKLRQGQSAEIMLKHGKNSKEFHAFVKEMHQQDALNLVRVEKYLEQHGFPKNGEFGSIATSIIPTVIHHSNSYSAREKFFPLLYREYKKGNYNEGGFAMFLNRMYHFKHGEREPREGTYQQKDEIEFLIKELGLKIPDS
ncbi:MAG: hypothetical protein AAFO07_21920, partial [Bacteroidota bacterium]